jgi:hypothetical protein
MNGHADRSDDRLDQLAGTTTASARKLDGFDVLILLAATILATQGAEMARALEPRPLVPQLPKSIGSPAPLLPSPVGALAPLVPSSPAAFVPPSPAETGAATAEPILIAPAERGVLARGLEISRPFLMAWTLAFPLLRLRRPRPSVRLLARQPGMAACAVATLVLVVRFSAITFRWALAWSWTALGHSHSRPNWSLGATTPDASPLLHLWQSIHLGYLESSSAAHGIAGAWVIMAVGGWWRPERSAIDWLGRALGVAWIALMLVDVIASFWRFPG